MPPTNKESDHVSLRDTILNASDLESRIVDLPQWGVRLEVRSLDGRSRAKLLAGATKADGGVDLERLYPDMVILCAYDPESGERVFTEDDRDALLAKSASQLEIVALTAMQVSGMTGEAQKEAGKGLPSTASDASSSS